jgi:hypothetical protein
MIWISMAHAAVQNAEVQEILVHTATIQITTNLALAGAAKKSSLQY